MIRVVVVGATGRMGSMACTELGRADGFTVVAQIGRGGDLTEAVEERNPDVVLELSLPSSAGKNAMIALEHAVPVVVGATGLKDDEVAAIRGAAVDVGAMIVPNFAIGAVLMMRLSALAARWLPDAEIVETHHEKKADAPSGTALRTAELISEARRTAPTFLPEPILKVPGARGGKYRDVPVHSLRLPGHVAHQSVVFGAPGESLTIRHDAIDRNCYAPGIMLALRRVMRLEELEIGLDAALFEGVS